MIVVTREEEAVTEPEPTPGTDKPSIPGSDEDQAGGGDWDCRLAAEMIPPMDPVLAIATKRTRLLAITA